jgi:hypothetical protein
MAIAGDLGGNPFFNPYQPNPTKRFGNLAQITTPKQDANSQNPQKVNPVTALGASPFNAQGYGLSKQDKKGWIG